jgi:hypothetical protein
VHVAARVSNPPGTARLRAPSGRGGDLMGGAAWAPPPSDTPGPPLNRPPSPASPVRVSPRGARRRTSRLAASLGPSRLAAFLGSKVDVKARCHSRMRSRVCSLWVCIALPRAIQAAPRLAIGSRGGRRRPGGCRTRAALVRWRVIFSRADGGWAQVRVRAGWMSWVDKNASEYCRAFLDLVALIMYAVKIEARDKCSNSAASLVQWWVRRYCSSSLASFEDQIC